MIWGGGLIRIARSLKLELPSESHTRLSQIYTTHTHTQQKKLGVRVCKI